MFFLSQTLFKTTPLILSGLANGLAFRCGLFNIGAEGQIIMGGFLCAWAGFTFAALPGPLLFLLCLAAAFAGGALWAAVPGLLKAWAGAHEVITTMMMNFIAMALTNYLVSAYFHLPETVHTKEIPSGAWLPRLDGAFKAFQGSPVNLALLVALAASGVLAYALWRTPLGFEWRALGANPRAARVGGVPVERRVFEVLLLSGGLAGLASVNFVLGYKHYFEQGFSGGQGFTGIAVAILGRNEPGGIILSALLFGLLAQGSLSLNLWIPKETLEIVEALIIFGVLVVRSWREKRA